jgi:hypothetical protein
MPIKVYIAPFRWYEKSKQQESTQYNGMVLDAFKTWEKVTAGMVRFQLVSRLEDSQINVVWRRIDRKSLGHCEFLVNDQMMIYSAEVSIGISDSVIHAQYNDVGEVKHTVLHEVAHALGLGHSDGGDDIMFVPHQWGIVELSARDIITMQWLYKLPVGFDYQLAGKNYKLEEPFTMQDVIDRIAGRTTPKTQNAPKFKMEPRQEKPEALLNQHDILSQRGKFFLATQNIQVPSDLKKRIIQAKLEKPDSL